MANGLKAATVNAELQLEWNEVLERWEQQPNNFHHLLSHKHYNSATSHPSCLFVVCS